MYLFIFYYKVKKEKNYISFNLEIYYHYHMYTSIQANSKFMIQKLYHINNKHGENPKYTSLLILAYLK